MIRIKANKDFNDLLVAEIEAFGRDLKNAVEEPMGPNDHSTWIKGLSDLSRVLTRHMPATEDQMPEDIPVLKPQMAAQKLEDLRGKLKDIV